jgi:hypothetical protein
MSGALLAGAALLAGGVFISEPSGAAEKADKADKKPKAEKKVSSPSGGAVKVESTKASGAGIVAKSKSCGGDPPKIEKVKPDEGKPGDKVLILGKNFGGPGCSPTVSFGPGNPAKVSPEDDTKVSVTVPQGKKGIELLTLTTASGEDSKPFLVK